MKPTEEQVERAVAALALYVRAWNLPLNPEHLFMLAGAVLTHFDTDSSWEQIEAHENAQITWFEAQQADLYRPRDKTDDGGE